MHHNYIIYILRYKYLPPAQRIQQSRSLDLLFRDNRLCWFQFWSAARPGQIWGPRLRMAYTVFSARPNSGKFSSKQGRRNVRDRFWGHTITDIQQLVMSIQRQQALSYSVCPKPNLASLSSSILPQQLQTPFIIRPCRWQVQNHR